MQFLTYISTALLLMLGNACVPGAPIKKANSSSLMASTDGFAKEDLSRLKPEHMTLSCAKNGEK